MKGRVCRVIIDKPRRGSINMALDYAMLHAVSHNSVPPTIRLYRWEKPAISIGYLQILHEVIRNDLCRNEDIPVIRRITNGGAVFHEQELTFSIAIPIKSRGARGAILDSFRDLCTPVIRVLQSLSLDASFRPVNDIVIGSSKVAGCPQARKDGVLLQHGNVLLDVDRRKWNRYLKAEKDKSLENSFGITCLRDFLGQAVTAEKFVNQLSLDLVEAFQQDWGAEMSFGQFSPAELEEASRIEKEQFCNPDWNEKRKAAG